MPRPEEFELMDPAAPRHAVLSEEAQRKRILIVGDIHGCADEFRELLAMHRHPDDTLILVGDLVNKGPKSAEVVPLARELGAFAVVGNHELASLAGRHARQGGQKPEAAKRYEWTDAMSEADVEFVRNLPYTLSLPLHNAIVVHAGLVPGVALEEQSLHHMVSMRTLRPAGAGGGHTAFEGDEDGATVRAPGV
jgi:bis(5'-nucleosyl)-tetraphosphatase (symmetrical)